MNVAMIQLAINSDDPISNYEVMAQRLEEAMKQQVKPDVIITNELWNTGYLPPKQLYYVADDHGQQTERIVSSLCQRYGVHVIAGTVAAKRGGDVFNTSLIFNREGDRIGEYVKTHLFSYSGEQHLFKAGHQLWNGCIDDVMCGINICYELRFPEMARTLALRGVKVLFVPAYWPKSRLYHWRSLIIARAIENQMYVVACNAGSDPQSDTAFGHSMVVDPWGEVVTEAGEEEAILQTTLDLSKVDEVRKKMSVFDDRVPSLYEHA
ncbi:carbon-nitrogen family hydrolase [Longirhabdus pacifica]|uniref:carbon-nitrogen family hydrolase n=1 Tax=Longirhabdus pacifica TaxID=2305227 RepID=UPI001008A12D|nr:carbon-nitrogen family hydrolase [Longirhabdus pacifica]